MAPDTALLEHGRHIYPQPVAIACDRVLRIRDERDELEALLKAGEVLTRYTAALAINSFAARTDSAVEPPPVFATLEKKLAFGDFLRVADAVAGVDVGHPLADPLRKAFKGKRGKGSGPAKAALDELVELRNQEAHNLATMSPARARALLLEHKPGEHLAAALDALDRLLEHPLFLVESQRLVRLKVVAQRLMLMGATPEPPPEEVVLKGGLIHDRRLYTNSGR